MFLIDQLILLVGLLLTLGIASSKLSTRVGLPVLVLFLMVGMLAGSEGPGGLHCASTSDRKPKSAMS
jgi:cell volume regulation protein A